MDVKNELMVLNENDFLNKTPAFLEKREQVMNSLIKVSTKKDNGKETLSQHDFFKADYGRLPFTAKDTLFNKGAMKLIQEFNLIFNFETQLSGNNVLVKSICYVKGSNTPLSVGLAGGSGANDKDYNKAVQMGRIRSQKVALRYALGLQDDLTQDIEDNYFEYIKKETIGKTKVSNIVNWLKKAKKDLQKEVSKEILSILKINHKLDITYETFKVSAIATIQKLTNEDYEMLKIKMIDLED